MSNTTSPIPSIVKKFPSNDGYICLYVNGSAYSLTMVIEHEWPCDIGELMRNSVTQEWSFYQMSPVLISIEVLILIAEFIIQLQELDEQPF